MKIVVIGCTESTKRFVNEILKNPEFEIVGIFTLEGKYAYKKSRFVLLDDVAYEKNIRLFKLSRIDDPKIIELIKDLKPDLILESGWSQIIPKEILQIPNKGCIGIHYSFLPKNQGAASLNWALIKGEKEWGVTLFYLEDKIDKGDIIDQRKFDIDESDNIKTLFDKADTLAIEMLRKNLPLIKDDKVVRKKQNEQEATYLPKRKPEDGKIDWTRPGKEIFNLVRAITKPYPGAFTFYNGKKILVWEAEEVDNMEDGEKPGTIVKILDKKGIVVAAGKGSILIKRAEFENDTEMLAGNLAEKYDLKESEKFD